MSNKNFLIADIGGTNARFALAGVDERSFHEVRTFACSDYANIDNAIEDYLQLVGDTHLEGLCVAVAGPVINGRVCLTNNHWQLSDDSLKTACNVANAHVLNDFESIAYALPSLSNSDLLAVGGDWQLPDGQDCSVAVLGPGSGLGVAGLCVREAHRYPLVGEGGHVGFSPEDSLQLELLKILMKQFKRVSAERFLSGPGLVNLYTALCEIHGVEPQSYSPAAIAENGCDSLSNQEDKVCALVMQLFFEILGQTAGDLALSQGALEGIYIGGGIVQRYPQALVNSKFRDGFESKGRHSELMKAIPTWLIEHKNAGLVGANYYANYFFRAC